MEAVKSNLAAPYSFNIDGMNQSIVLSQCFAQQSRKAGFLKLFGSKEVQNSIVCTRNILNEIYTKSKQENQQ